jgi:Ser/Thr protein kinase RdoA (MazF antagonist)
MTADNIVDSSADKTVPAGLFAQAALSLYDFPSGARPTLISQSENATFLIEDEAPLGVLRIYRQDYQSAAAIRSELAWIEAVRRDTSVNTPKIRATSEGEPVQWVTVDGITRACAVFEHVNGEAPTPDDLVTYELVGATSAALHDHAERWQRPEGFVRYTWDLEGIIGRGALWGSWLDAPALDPAGIKLLTQAETKFRERLADYPAEPPHGGLVHCDLRSANLLKDPEGGVWVIDFDDSGFSWYLWDLCSSTTFEEATPNCADIVSAWLNGYAAVRNLTRRDRDAIPDLVFLRRMHILAWLSTHPESDLAREVGGTYTAETCDLATQYLQGRFLHDI